MNSASTVDPALEWTRASFAAELVLCRLCSDLQPNLHSSWWHTNLLPFLTMLQLAAILGDTSVCTLFPNNNPASSWASFLCWPHPCLTQSSASHMNMAYKTVLIRASTIKSLIFMTVKPCSSPETFLTYLPYQTALLQSSDISGLPALPDSPVPVQRRS